MEFDILFLQATTNCPACLWKIIGMFLLALLLGLLLGAIIWRRYKTMVQKVEKERDDYHEKLTETEKDYAGLKYQYDEQTKDNAALKSKLNKCEADKATMEFRLNKALQEGDGNDGGTGGDTGSASTGFVAGAGAQTGYAAIFTEDNLQIVEGIGPKIEQLLKDAGIGTWGALSAASDEKLRSVLDAAGPKYRMHNPKSWSEQAKLAAEGKWLDLISYQKFLDGGRESGTDGTSPSKVEKLYSKALGFSSMNPDDLKVVEGIGPKIEGVLKEAGIKNWSDLAATGVDRIKVVLSSSSSNFRLAKPDTWPKQAQLAADGKWGELKEYQDFLQGGNDPG